MGYPSQPQGPYGQQPQQPYGHSGPHYGGYGYPPPPPPPPRRSNTGLIVLLAVGVPLMLLGGCAAVLVAFSNSGRETVVTEADPPSHQPAASAMTEAEPSSAEPAVEEEAVEQEQSAAAVGGAITLVGRDPGLRMKVTVTQVVDPATPENDFIKPKTGSRLVAVQVTLSNVGKAVYDDSPTNGATLIDGEGQEYRRTYIDVREGQSFRGSSTISVGDTRKGMIVYEMPEGAKPAKFQFALDSGFAEQKGEWTLN